MLNRSPYVFGNEEADGKLMQVYKSQEEIDEFCLHEGSIYRDEGKSYEVVRLMPPNQDGFRKLVLMPKDDHD